MNEAEIISILRRIIPAGHGQWNATFTSDAEIVRIGETVLALTVDDFSAEDGFPEQDARELGWNLAVATLSDLLAVGAEPAYLMQSVVLPQEMTRERLESLGLGIKDALDVFGVHLLGGDVGGGKEWRYSGIGIGTISPGWLPVSRLASCDEGSLWVTGSLGDGNLAAVGAVPSLRLECRQDEARRIRGVAAACMDTSDGFFITLGTLSRLNPSLRIEVELGAVPMAHSVDAVARTLAVPPEAFLLGSAGEYELLALLPEEVDARQDGFRRIGTFSRAVDPGVFLKKGDLSILLPPGSLPEPRSFPEREAYIETVIRLSRKWFG